MRGQRDVAIGLPAGTQACLFDLDGVLTDTARLHTAAWQETFDEFLRNRATESGEPFRPFDPAGDYLAYVDGKPRLDGVRDFLRSRDITLPEGAPGDPADALTVHGVGNRKNQLLLYRIHHDGVEVFEGSRRYLEATQCSGLRRAVVSSSANTADVLAVTGLDVLVEVRVDGVTIRDRGLRGKPAPDTFLLAAEMLEVDPAHAAVFEDALAGVAAGRDGGFCFVVGVDRAGQSDALREHGADCVVSDLAQLLDGSAT